MDNAATVTDFLHECVAAAIPRGSGVLVALSGGADSVALLHLVATLGYRCEAVHCNYHLRGAESDRDCRHAADVCRRLGVRFHLVDCDVEAWRRDNRGSSVEMACRDLRYREFDRLLVESHLDLVAVAHHSEDCDETMLLNLLRGTGMRGLAAMKPRRDNIVRPLLEATRGDIEQYLSAHSLTWVTDSSNADSRYRRNALRNEIIPLILNHFPAARQGFATTRRALANQEMLLDDYLDLAARTYMHDGAVDIKALVERERHPARLLYSLLKSRTPAPLEHGEVVKLIERSGDSGLQFGHWRLHRGMLTPCTVQQAIEPVVLSLDEMKEGEERLFDLGNSTLKATLVVKGAFGPTRDPRVMWLDYDYVKRVGEFTVRAAQAGDRLQPYGMKGSRLVSDILHESHLSLADRRTALVLEARGTLLWVIGHRASRHGAVSAATTAVLKLEQILD